MTGDGKEDLIISATAYNSFAGRVYVFYNDGSIATSTAGADEFLTGQSMGYELGKSLVVGDFNANGVDDLAIGSAVDKVYMYLATSTTLFASSTGPAGIFYGESLATGDFNSDGKDDLAVGGYGYNSNMGKVFILLSTSTTVYASTTGETTNSYFGSSLSSGDFNQDGKIDLAVGSKGYTTNTGAVYILNNDGTYPSTAASADMKITGENQGNYYGSTIFSTDINNDGKIDLLVGAPYFNNSQGRAYMYTFNDRVITGVAADSMVTGDFNGDGKPDLAVGESSQDRVYIFYNTVNTKTASTADIIITGEAGSYFGYSLTSADFNTDGKTDIAIGATGYNSEQGRTYIFYSNLTTESVATADITLTGENQWDRFGESLATADFNADGKTDIAVGAKDYNSNQGRAYIFYANHSSKNASSADVVITGENEGDSFGISLAATDFNDDGKKDIAIGAYGASSYSYQGRVYIFYSTLTTVNATSAQVILTGESNMTDFGKNMIAEDFNADGHPDLAVAASYYWGGTGRVYMFYSNIMTKNATFADVILTGDSGDRFGESLATGDLNNDGKADLAVGAVERNYPQGGAYIFYSNFTTESAATADIILAGEVIGDSFGEPLTCADFNADGKTDLAIGVKGNSRVYMYINETKKDITTPTPNHNGQVIFNRGTTIKGQFRFK